MIIVAGIVVGMFCGSADAPIHIGAVYPIFSEFTSEAWIRYAADTGVTTHTSGANGKVDTLDDESEIVLDPMSEATDEIDPESGVGESPYILVYVKKGKVLRNVPTFKHRRYRMKTVAISAIVDVNRGLDTTLSILGLEAQTQLSPGIELSYIDGKTTLTNPGDSGARVKWTSSTNTDYLLPGESKSWKDVP